MNHKLQDSSFTNDGTKTVGRNTNSISISEIPSNHAGSREARAADSLSETTFGPELQLVENARPEAPSDVADDSHAILETSIQQEISTGTISAPVAQPPSVVLPAGIDVSFERKNPTEFSDTSRRGLDPGQQEVEPTQPAAAVRQVSFVDLARCEVARSAGYDPTGEHAFPCGALAQVLCEYCGPTCSTCADETFCFQGEHKLTSLPDDGPLPSSHQTQRPISEVVM